MTSKTEAPRTGDFILSLASGTRSVENVIFAAGFSAFAGTVVGKNDDEKIVPLDLAEVDPETGAETVVGILRDNIDATDGKDVATVIVARDAEVKVDALVWPDGITEDQQDEAIAELNALGIYPR